MIALQRAELTLQFTVQIRNKLVQAYQESCGCRSRRRVPWPSDIDTDPRYSTIPCRISSSALRKLTAALNPRQLVTLGLAFVAAVVLVVGAAWYLNAPDYACCSPTWSRKKRPASRPASRPRRSSTS